MVRTIIKPTKNDFTIHLPDELIGKMVEVIAFVIDDDKHTVTTELQNHDKISSLKKELSELSFNSGGYKFNRNEANDYE